VLSENHREFLEAIDKGILDTVRSDDPLWLAALHSFRRQEIKCRGSQEDNFFSDIELTSFGQQVLFLARSVEEKSKREKRKTKVRIIFDLIWQFLNKAIVATIIGGIIVTLILAYFRIEK
jgi:hypothetical protein